MTTKDRIHELVDRLPEEQTADALDYLRWLLLDEDEASPEELAEADFGREQIARGEYVSLKERDRRPTTTAAQT